MRIVLITTLTALALAGIVVSCSAGVRPTPTEFATPTLPPSPTLTIRAPVASATPYPTRILTPTPPGYPLTVTVRAGWPLTGTAEAALPPTTIVYPLTATASAGYSLTATARPTPIVHPTIRPFLTPTTTMALPTIELPSPESVIDGTTAKVRVPEPTSITSDSRCLVGLEPLAEDILQTIENARYLAQTFFKAWGSQDMVTWRGGTEELDEFVGEIMEQVLIQIADVEAEGQEEVWAQAVRELDLKIAGMWRDLGNGRAQPVAQLFIALADAQALDLGCQFGDFDCSNRQAVARGQTMARAATDLADAGEGCMGFYGLTAWFRNIADVNLALVSEFAE